VARLVQDKQPFVFSQNPLPKLRRLDHPHRSLPHTTRPGARPDRIIHVGQRLARAHDRPAFFNRYRFNTAAPILATQVFGNVELIAVISLFFRPVTTSAFPVSSAFSVSRTTCSLVCPSDAATLPSWSPARRKKSVAVGPGHTASERTPVPRSSSFSARLQ